MTTVNVYTDGSTLNNQHKGKRYGGIGVFFAENDTMNCSIPLIETALDKVTNQVAEIKACIVAVEIAIEKQLFNDNNCLNICSDSLYTINCITKWCKNWKINNWKKSDGKKIENLQLISNLYDYYLKYNIKFTHIRGHTSEPSDPAKYNNWYGNMMADKLATDASKSVRNNYITF